MHILTLMLLLFTSFSFACSTNEKDHELPAFAVLTDNAGYFDIYADKAIIDPKGREAKIDSIEVYIKDKFHLRLKVENAEYSYKGYFVASGMLSKKLINDTKVLVKYHYGDLTMCAPTRHHKLTELFSENKPPRVIQSIPPKPKLPAHIKAGA